MVDVYQKITDLVIQNLEKTGGWVKGWKTHELGNTKNLISKKNYRGINIFITNWFIAEKGFNSPYFLTFNQAKQRGGHIKKGEKGIPIIYWNIRKEEVRNEDGTTTEKEIPILKYFVVFNVEQTTIKLKDEEKPKKKSEEDKLNFNPIHEAELIIQQFKNKPSITHGGNRAYYTPSEDRIQLPKKEDFNSVEDFYETLFHELTHSTGHEKRLNREGIKRVAFGSGTYSKEELIAELGSAFLCALSGIDNPKVLENQTAYIKGWVKKLRNDKKLIIQASKKAEVSTDYILNGRLENGTNK